MAYFEFHDTLHEHHKLIALARALHIGRPAALWHLTLGWCWAMRYQPSGNCPATLWEDACRWSGRPGVWLSACILVGFAEKDGERIQLHDWHEYTKAYRKAIVDRDRLRVARESRDRSANAAVNRAEQNRTEQSGEEGYADASPPSPASSSPPEPEASEPTRLLMQLAKKAKCPNRLDTIRQYIEALRARQDVGSQKLEQYLLSPEAQGKTVNDWNDHFRQDKLNKPYAPRRSTGNPSCPRCSGSGLDRSRYVPEISQYAACECAAKGKVS